MEHRYSAASEVWAFGVLMYEVLTYGCIPYRNVLKDDEVPLCVSFKTGILICQSRNALQINGIHKNTWVVFNEGISIKLEISSEKQEDLTLLTML